MQFDSSFKGRVVHIESSKTKDEGRKYNLERRQVMKKELELDRRRFLKASAFTLGAAMVGIPQFSLGQGKLPDSIVSMAGGGDWGKVYKQVVCDPWTKKSGVQVILFTGEPAEGIAKIRANIENPPMHLIFMPEAMVPDSIKWGILDPMSLKTVPNLKDVKPWFHDRFDNYVCTNNYIFCVLLYNKKKIKNIPKTWVETVDRTIKGEFGRRVSFPSLSYGYAYPFFWAVGKELGDKVEKMDATFEKFKQMKPYVPKFWTTAVEALNLIEAGEVDIVVYWEHRGWKFIDQGHEGWDIAIPTPGVYEGTVMGKVKNAHPVIFDLLNFILDTEIQSKWAEGISTHPVNSKSKTSAIMQARFDRTTPKGELFTAPSAEIAKVKQEWLDRWNKEIGG
jgi:putative spermidine/putrescine transport system substrate-binding protein